MKHHAMLCGTVLVLLGMDRGGGRGAAADEELTPAGETQRLDLIDSAKAAHAAGDHGKALETAQKALRLKRTPSLQLFVAKEAKETGALSMAYGESRLCVVEATRDKSLRNRTKIIAECQELRDAVKDRVGFVVLQLDNPPDGLKITVAGEELSVAALGSPYAVTPGSIEVEASAPSFGSFHASIVVPQGGKKEISVSLSPPATHAPAPGTDPETASPPTSGTVDVAAVYPSAAPPEPVPEIRPAPPGPAYFWSDGYWDWSGSDWVWRSGVWAPTRVGYLYVQPTYVWVGNRPAYTRGYWRSPNGSREYGEASRGAAPAVYRGSPRVAPQTWRAQPAHAVWRGPPARGIGPQPGVMRPSPIVQQRPGANTRPAGWTYGGSNPTAAGGMQPWVPARTTSSPMGPRPMNGAAPGAPYGARPRPTPGPGGARPMPFRPVPAPTPRPAPARRVVAPRDPPGAPR